MTFDFVAIVVVAILVPAGVCGAAIQYAYREGGRQYVKRVLLAGFILAAVLFLIFVRNEGTGVYYRSEAERWVRSVSLAWLLCMGFITVPLTLVVGTIAVKSLPKDSSSRDDLIHVPTMMIIIVLDCLVLSVLWTMRGWPGGWIIYSWMTAFLEAVAVWVAGITLAVIAEALWKRRVRQLPGH